MAIRDPADPRTRFIGFLHGVDMHPWANQIE